MSGRRNEPARARRRNQMKQALSLTSVPNSEDDAPGHSTNPKLTLEKHFGWAVVQKTQIGDGNFPHLFQYLEKPDLHGREFDKVTYVLYMDKGTVVDKSSSINGNQTAVSGVLISEKPSTPGDYYDRTRVEERFGGDTQPKRPRVSVAQEDKATHMMPDRRKKKKIISDFYYVKRDRSRSRSRPGGDRNKVGPYGTGYDWQNQTPEASKSYLSQMNHEAHELEENTMKEKDQAIWDEIEQEKEYAIKSANKNNTAKINQLRAGAEKIEREYIELKEKYNKNSPVVNKKTSKVLEYVKCKSDKYEIVENLLKTSSGTNQYLYVSGKKRAK